MRYSLFLLSFLTIFFLSCDRIEKPAYSQFIKFPVNGLEHDKFYEFTPFSDDTLNFNQLYDIVLMVRYNRNYKYTDFPLIIEEEWPMMERILSPDTLNLNLFSEDNRSMGKGNIGIFELSDTLKRSVALRENYKIFIKTPLEDSKGIEAIGVKTLPSHKIY